MNITALPTTKLGRWSSFLALGMIVFAFVGVITGKLGQILPILAWLCGAAAFVVGIISFIKSKERSILVGLAVLLGLLVVIAGFLPES